MWIIRAGDVVVESDDFTIEDLQNVEKATDTPWSIANPLKDIKVARAFLAVAYQHAGKDEAEIIAVLKAATLKTLKTTFDYVADEDVPSEEGGDPLDRPVKITPGSSRGRPIKGGSRPIQEDNVSEIS